jgi:NAD(P)-dependent dehydrogenase (short-subunit alcohol dehydrogenase family)
MVPPMAEKPSILITGGSKGIGRATAELALERGFRVIVLARNFHDLEAFRKHAGGGGHRPDDIETLVVDMENLEAIEALPARIPWLTHGLHGLVLNAALQILRPAHHFETGEITRSLTVNITANILMIRTLFDALKQTRGGICVVGSVADERNNPTYALYSACKAFMKTFVRQSCTDFGPEGVRINMVSPGCTATETPDKDKEPAKGGDLEHVIYSRIPIEQRDATPREVAECILFTLGGPRYLHGADLRVDGGMY